MLDLDTPLALLVGVNLDTIGKTPRYIPPTPEGDIIGFDPTCKDPCAIWPLRNLPGGKCTMTQQDDKMVLSTVMNNAPWICLSIPDGFLFYNKAGTSVEITIQVYGMCEAQKSGFSIYYDALGGMNHTPWKWIDTDEQKLYTYTTRLDDAIFANREGYDLRIEMGGSKENIRLVDVTARKLPK